MSNISPPVRKRAISGTSTGCTHRIDRDRLVSPANIVNGIRLKTSSFSAIRLSAASRSFWTGARMNRQMHGVRSWMTSFSSLGLVPRRVRPPAVLTRACLEPLRDWVKMRHSGPVAPVAGEGAGS